MKRDEIAAAVALDRSVFHGSRLIGPSLAGLFVGWWGAASAFFTNALSFVALIAALISLPKRPLGTPEEEKQRRSGILGGISVCWPQSHHCFLHHADCAEHHFRLSRDLSDAPAFGEPSMKKGPKTVDSVAPEVWRLFYAPPTSIDSPRVSEARMNSWRLSSVMWPVAREEVDARRTIRPR